MTAPAMDLDERARVVFTTPGEAHNFFGYYGMSPLDRSGRMLLAHQTSFGDREAAAGDRAVVGYWDLDEGTFHEVGETGAFNLQQGAMLQWLPPDNTGKLVYNDVVDGRYVSRIVDLAAGSERILPHTVYALHPGGRLAIAPKNERLYFCRPGYRYTAVVDERWDRPVSTRDGAFLLDLETGESRQVLSTLEVARKSPLPGTMDRDNYLEIFTWNPSGTRFAFFHRWNDARGRHRTRLFTADPDGGEMHMFPDTGFYSHYAWKNDREITVWARHDPVGGKLAAEARRNPLASALLRRPWAVARKLLGRSARAANYLPATAWLELTDGTRQVRVLDPELLPENGHNTWTSDERWMLTDTYEDQESYRHLLLYDAVGKAVHRVGRFFSPYNRTTWRCDLHPRFDHGERLAVVDTAHDGGTRRMVVLDLSGIMDG